MKCSDSGGDGAHICKTPQSDCLTEAPGVTGPYGPHKPPHPTHPCPNKHHSHAEHAQRSSCCTIVSSYTYKPPHTAVVWHGFDSTASIMFSCCTAQLLSHAGCKRWMQPNSINSLHVLWAWGCCFSMARLTPATGTDTQTQRGQRQICQVLFECTNKLAAATSCCPAEWV